MTATSMEGTALAAALLEQTAARVGRFVAARGRPPCLATVLIGEDPASHTYVRMKVNRSRRIGISSRREELPDDAGTDQAVALVSRLAENDEVDGILVQHPAPSQVDEHQVFEAIPAAKDVDGVTAASFSAMAGLAGPVAGFNSCTPGGIIRLLDSYRVPLAGRRAVVVGRSAILGKPMGMLLLGRDATVTLCHSKTTDLAGEVGRADVVVAAVGRPELVRGDWIAPGAVVIDAGYHPGGVGDVEQSVARERASLITPVPGGVGPMTIAVLLAQTVTAAERRAASESAAPTGC